MYTYVGLYISKMNDSNDTRNGKKELGLFCYYKLLILFMKWYSVV